MGAVRRIRQSTAAELQWFCTGLHYAPQMDLKGLTGIDASGNVVALIGFDGWTKGSVCLHSWISQGALTRAFMREVVRYPFSTGRRVLIGKTPANNAKALKFNKHYGFKEVYRIRDGFADGVDMVIQELRHDECRWYKHDGNGNTTAATSCCAASSRSTENAPGELPSPDAKPGTAGDDQHCQSAAHGPVRGPCYDWSATDRGARTTHGEVGPGSQLLPGHGLATAARPATSPLGCPHSSAGADASPTVSGNADAAVQGNATAGADQAAPGAAVGGPAAEFGSSVADVSNALGPNVEGRWYSPGGSSLDEDVSVEPRCDIEAQLDDLWRPGSKRMAVYLSPRNDEAHEWAWDDPRSACVYWMGTHGTLIFRNQNDCNTVADKLWKQRLPLRQVIGEAVMAGQGKPEFSADACVAQHLTESGSVDRESLQPSEQAALQMLQRWTDCVEGSSHIISVQQALERRHRLVATASA